MSGSEEAGATGEPAMEETASNSPYVIAIVVGGIIALAYYFLVMKKKEDGSKKNRGKNVDVDETMATNSVGMKDITYIASKLKPDSTHMDILLAVASSPESIMWGTRAHLRKEKLKADRLEEDKKEKAESKLDATKKTDSNNNMFELDDDGWADEDEDMDEEAKEKAKLAKKAEEDEGKTYLHRGIATRAFERRFHLADHVKVTGASYVNGMLNIDLVREVPEALKPRTIAIESGSMIDAKPAKKVTKAKAKADA